MQIIDQIDGAHNKRPGVDAGGAICLHIGRRWPSATQAERWAGGAAAIAHQPQRGEWRLHKALECENHWAFEAFCKAK